MGRVEKGPDGGGQGGFVGPRPLQSHVALHFASCSMVTVLIIFQFCKWSHLGRQNMGVTRGDSQRRMWKVWIVVAWKALFPCSWRKDIFTLQWALGITAPVLDESDLQGGNSRDHSPGMGKQEISLQEWWPTLFVVYVGVGGGCGEVITTSWPERWTRGIRGPSSPPLSLEGTFCPFFPQWGLFSRIQPWESKVVLRSSGQYIDEHS